MPGEEESTVYSLLTLPSGWLPIVVLAGAGSAILGVLVTWVALVIAGVSPGTSRAPQFLVGGPIPTLKGVVWFFFDTHGVGSRTGQQLSILGASADPIEVANSPLWPMHIIPGVIGLGAVAAVRSLEVTDGFIGAVTGAGTTLGYFPVMLLLWWFSRVPLMRHAGDGQVPLGISVEAAQGVTAGPGLSQTVLFVPVLAVIIGTIAGAVGVERPLSDLATPLNHTPGPTR